MKEALFVPLQTVGNLRKASS